MGILDSIEEYSEDDYSLPSFNYINNKIFLGAMPDYGEARLFNHIVCVTDATPNYACTDLLITWAPFRDIPKMPPLDLLHRIADLVHENSKTGTVLVHCTAGLNRSAMIVALVLVKHHGWTARQAVVHLRNTRGNAVLHNTVFHDWLMTL
jgi:protein-tyrosine phosphatase